MSDRSKEELIAKIDAQLAEHKLDRREFGRYVLRTFGAVVSTTTLATALDAFVAEKASALASYQDYEAIIIGSGIGGSVLAARLSKKWPGKVLLIERGKRYPKGSFPRTGPALVDALMRTPNDGAPRIFDGNLITGYSNGLLDLRSFGDMDVITGNGYGGGSLIYAAVKLEPTVQNFDEAWPSTIKRAQLKPYWDVYRKVMLARPVPQNGEPDRELVKLSYHRTIAAGTGGQSELVDIAVFFGNDFEHPTPMGQEQTNVYGAPQTSCVYCAECLLGCNFHAKNSTDLNYLYVAEKQYGMRVLTEKRVDKIVPMNALGWSSPMSDGSNGFRVYYSDAMAMFLNTQSVTAKRVIVAAGSLGSTEILLRNKYVHGTLASLSPTLGQDFSGNGDWIGMEINSAVPDGHAHGPTIVQRINYPHPTDPSKTFIWEDGSLPPLLEIVDWLLGNAIGLVSPFRQFWQSIKDGLVASQGQNSGTAAILMIGKDKSDGTFHLDPVSGGLRLDWSYWSSHELHEMMSAKLQQARQVVGATLAIPFPTYPLLRNLTAHPLGGCKLGTGANNSVTDSNRSTFGCVHNYNNLYVADGALVPSAIGANPSLTIGALAEMVAEGITGTAPTPVL